MTINTSRQHQKQMYFCSPLMSKTGIVLHFTAGTTADGAITTFEASRKSLGYAISVPYVVANDSAGTVYQLFDDRYWAYNLGIKGTASESHRHDKRTVAIEIVNPGPLRRAGDIMCFWPNNWSAKYCLASEKELYREAEYRGERYWAEFSHQQAASVVELCNHICDKHPTVKRLIPQDSIRLRCDTDHYSKFSGVFSHCNVRPDKWDIGPAGDAIWYGLLGAGFTVA